jgi:hypothetical protein
MNNVTHRRHQTNQAEGQYGRYEDCNTATEIEDHKLYETNRTLIKNESRAANKVQITEAKRCI